MAAAKALLTAAGLLKPKTKQPNTSAATEHATSSDQVSLRIDISVRPLTGLSTSTSSGQASASEDAALLGDDDLEKIVALLLWMAQDFQSSIPIHEIHLAALQAIIKHSNAATGGALGLLHTASIAKLSKLIDLMMLDKHGAPKDASAALNFMRRTAKVREELLPTASDNATERVELIAKTTCLGVISGLLASCSHMTSCHTRSETRGISSKTIPRATRRSLLFSDPGLTICFASFWVTRKWLFSFGNTASRASLTIQ